MEKIIVKTFTWGYVVMTSVAIAVVIVLMFPIWLVLDKLAEFLEVKHV